MHNRLLRGASLRLGFLTAIFIAGGLAAHAEPARPLCAAIAGPRDAINQANGGRWIVLTDLQRAFLAGIFVLDPNTPPGLPFGDKAALVRMEGDRGGVVFFIDGDQACTPMPVPEELIEMIRAIGAGDVTHEGTEN